MPKKIIKNSDEFITVHGAREHNLRGIDVKIPIDKLTVVTGLSGSGKSTLAFDTIYAEGQRRYVESLSAYARQFLGLMQKPDVDSISGLSPAISIEQKTVSKNPRSTVGTITEIYDYLRLLYARAGDPHCPQCGKAILPQSPAAIVQAIIKDIKTGQILILAPLVSGKKGTYEQLFADLDEEGYSRVRVDGEVVRLDESKELKLKRYVKHDIEVVVDRFSLTKENRGRLSEAVETSLKRGKGMVLAVTEKTGKKKAVEKLYSQYAACADCGINLPELEPRLFSFNSPFGACETCHGLGVKQEFDPDLVVPDKTLCMADGAIKPWRNLREGWRRHYMERVADTYDFDLYTPWCDLSDGSRHIVLHGTPEDESGWGRKFEGVIPQLERMYKQTDSDGRRDEMSKFIRDVECPDCSGQRLKPVALSVTVGDKGIYDITEMSIGALSEFFKKLKLSKQNAEIAKPILREIGKRLSFLVDVGLDYLTLSRSARTLSGGEGQRIRLATQIGSELRGVLYILDEPSIGLHQRDNRKLITTLKKLRDLRNTVLVVEHDEETMLQADYLLDLGPGAGIHGGEVVYAGAPAGIKRDKKSLTGAYLSGKEYIPIPDERRKAFDYLTIEGAAEHNLKDLTVKFPLKVFTCVTGVSGSGKSTLVNEIMYKALHKVLHVGNARPGLHRKISGHGRLEKVIIVDQSPIGRTPRSNPVTYTGAFTHIRELFSMTKEAKVRGYKPGRFSFNVSGGRCEECEGDGVKKIEMHFLPDVYVECEQCQGKRYNEETLAVTYKGKNIAQVLDMTVEEAHVFFKSIPSVKNKLQVLSEIGLGYVRLGQSSTTLSGGEAQRIKLSSELSRRGGDAMYILDEPTTGLHFADVQRLLKIIDRLVEKGNSVVVIEHNLDVVKSADWVIDLGPEGGEGGGRVIAEGTPERIAKSSKWSYTGQYLQKILKK
ncbi:excinuclease ABC subunit A [bacterium]|nr:excinuclease ABC subunit A [bacterium]